MVVEVFAVVICICEDAEYPTTFRATAVNVCGPLTAVVVSKVTWYGADVSSSPMLFPSILNWTPTTLSDTVAETAAEPVSVAPPAGAVIATDTFDTVTLMGADGALLPA